MAVPAPKRVTNFSGGELHIRHITSTAADASFDIELPSGLYYLGVVGKQTAAGSDGTLLVQKYTDEAQTAANLAPVPGEDTATGTPVVTAIDLELANDYVDLWFSGVASAVQVMPIFIPYGLKITLDANGITAIDISLFAHRIG